MGLNLRERKQIINGATESLPEYANGTYNGQLADKYRDTQNKWLHAPSVEAISGMATTGINFAGSVMNSFGPVKSAGDILQESGTSVGQGSGFSYQKQNAVDAGAQMDELSKQNTANTLNTAASGASLGSAFGPIGAGIGGVVGGAVGFIGGLFRKNKMAERIRQAQIQAVRNNDFNLASAQTDYLTNQYNVEHDNTQDDMLYAAKEGLEPTMVDNAMQMSGFVKNNGRYVFDGRMKISNGEVYGHVDNRGRVIDAHVAGSGVDNKDSLIRRAGNTPNEVERAFVLSNKEENGLNGIAPSTYAKMTKDYDGAIAMQNYSKEMKSHTQEVREIRKAIENGAFGLPTDILAAKCGKLPRFVGGFEPQEVNKESDDVLYKRNTTSKSPMEMLKEAITNDPAGAQHFVNSVGGGPVYTNELERRFEENPNMKDSSSWTNPNDWVVRNGNLVSRQQAALDDANKNIYNSNWLNAIANGLSMVGGIAQIAKSYEEPAKQRSVYYNSNERQAANLALNRRSNLNQQLADSARAEAMNRYNINRLGGYSGAQKMAMIVNNAIANQYTNARLRATDNEYKNNRDFQNAQFLAGLGDTRGKYNWQSDETFFDRYNRTKGMQWANWQQGVLNMINPFQSFAKGYDKNMWRKSILPLYTTDFNHIK